MTRWLWFSMTLSLLAILISIVAMALRARSRDVGRGAAPEEGVVSRISDTSKFKLGPGDFIFSGHDRDGEQIAWITVDERCFARLPDGGKVEDSGPFCKAMIKSLAGTWEPSAK